MEKSKIIEAFQESPIIMGIKSETDFPLVKENDSKIVFTLCGNISNITHIVEKLKSMGKLVFVNIDMVDGFASRSSVIDFIINSVKADGIISAKPNLLRYARSKKLFTIHRFFILDSSSWRNIGRQLEISQADIIDITPGWTKVIAWTVNKFSTPVMASGLVCDKPTVIDSLKAGAIAICTTNHDVWKL